MAHNYTQQRHNDVVIKDVIFDLSEGMEDEVVDLTAPYSQHTLGSMDTIIVNLWSQFSGGTDGGLNNQFGRHLVLKLRTWSGCTSSVGDVGAFGGALHGLECCTSRMGGSSSQLVLIKDLLSHKVHSVLDLGRYYRGGCELGDGEEDDICRPRRVRHGKTHGGEGCQGGKRTRGESNWE